ncbi:MAG TPA: hypothetical protein VHG32_25505 [Thermoanaerobaculia bacterium]|nr:hypothetical protein [Thermoanaerobaculia bacterium]
MLHELDDPPASAAELRRTTAGTEPEHDPAIETEDRDDADVMNRWRQQDARRSPRPPQGRGARRTPKR